MLELMDLLTGPPMETIAAESMYRNLDAAINGGFPALVLEEGDEPTPGLESTGSANRHLNVQVRIVIKGDQPYSLADEPLMEAYGRIMNDRTVSGLAIDLREGPTKRERGMLEKPVGIITKNFLVQFETGQDSLS